MKYYEVNIKPRDNDLDDIISLLASSDITDIEIVDPKEIEEMLWDVDPTEYVDHAEFSGANSSEALIRYYMPYDESLSGEVELPPVLQNMSGTIGIDIRIVDDTDWKDRWKEYFVPTKVTDSIWVKPSWVDFESDNDDIVISIDPGMAFGTGTHETTYLTLRLIEKYIREGARVLDIGCGSGILSIAAAMLGAREVTGVDIDDEAVRVSNENIESNGMIETAVAVSGDPVNEKKGNWREPADARFDMIVANLLTELVMELSGKVADLLADGGVYIMSGILDEHSGRVIEHLEICGFRILETVSEGGWTAIAVSDT